MKGFYPYSLPVYQYMFQPSNNRFAKIKVNFVESRKKVDEKYILCDTLLLCDPGWCVHKSDVQNNWDDNTHTTLFVRMKT